MWKIPWRRAWQPTPVFLPGEAHGQRSLAGYSPGGHTELDTLKRLSTDASSVQFQTSGCPWSRGGSESESCSVMTPRTIQPMEFSRPEYWSGEPFPSPGDPPNPGIEPRSPALQADSVPAEPAGRPRGLRWRQGEGPARAAPCAGSPLRPASLLLLLWAPQLTVRLPSCPDLMVTVSGERLAAGGPGALG